MKTIKLVATGLIASATLFSCQKDDIETPNTAAPTEQALNRPDAVTTAKLVEWGLNVNNVERFEEKDAEGNVTKGWIDGDIIITDEHLEQDLPTFDENSGIAKAFRRPGIIFVAPRQTRTLTYYSSRDFNDNQRRILEGVINTLNSLNLRLRFVTRPQTTFTDPGFFDVNSITITASDRSNVNIQGSAPLPLNGGIRPRANINVPSNVDNNALRGIMMHEILHTLGLVHSDFRTGNSCPQGSAGRADQENFGSPSWHIPGTAFDGNFMNSIMTTCYIGNFNLSGEDVAALRGLYGF